MSARRGRKATWSWYRTRILLGGVAVATLVSACGSAGGGAMTIGSPRTGRASTAGAGRTKSASTAGVGRTKGATGMPATARAVASTRPLVVSTPRRRLSPAVSNWPVYDRTAGRSGVSVSTPKVTRPSAVKRGWTAHVDGAIYGQPLVAGQEVVVATENDSVYALDRNTGRQLWRRHLGTPVTGGLACAGNINPSGITGTPVADVATNRLYVVSFSPYRHTLWTFDLTTGRVEASRAIDGPGDDPKAEQQRSALAIQGSKVFVAYGGLNGDCGDYRGWVVGAPLSGHGRLVHYVTPTQREAGIWSPPGPSAGRGGIYVATGNGTPVNAIDNSDSVIRLSAGTLRVKSTFTPSDYVKLSTDDLDLGTTSPVLLPHNQVFMIGKEGIGYLLGATHLGGVGHPLAHLAICSGGFGGDAVVGETVIMSCFSALYAVRVTPGSVKAKPGLRVIWSAQSISPGPPIVAGGIVWDITRSDQLLGFQLGDGHQWFETGTASVVTDFPSLSASKGRLFVPEGSEVVSYRGV